ncbi:MAG TPA: hypothetical protein VMU10_09885 [Desulfomonilia bacterium]|nr:hypothetical protein [Desulfomonilia bacterium]
MMKIKTKSMHIRLHMIWIPLKPEQVWIRMFHRMVLNDITSSLKD